MPGYKVLLVDTEKNVLLAYQAVLEEEGYQVDIATNEKEALDKLSCQSFSVLITEFYLKGKTTIELVKKVKQDYPELYTIMISAVTLKTDTYEEIIDAGVDDYFIKPFSSRNLLVNIKKGLKIRAQLMRSAKLEERIKNMELLFSTDPNYSNENKLLYNNLHFQKKLRDEIVRAQRYNTQFSLLLFDLNASGNGHKDLDAENMDTIANTISQILLDHTRQTDVITKYDGSFAIILIETTKEGTKILAERLREHITNISTSTDAQHYHQIIENAKFDFVTYPEQSEIINKWAIEARKKWSN